MNSILGHKFFVIGRNISWLLHKIYNRANIYNIRSQWLVWWYLWPSTFCPSSCDTQTDRPAGPHSGGDFQLNARPTLTASKHISVWCLVRGLCGWQDWKQVPGTNCMHNMWGGTTRQGTTIGRYRARQFVFIFTSCSAFNFPLPISCRIPSVS
jgi:hypothetical protein